MCQISSQYWILRQPMDCRMQMRQFGTPLHYKACRILETCCLLQSCSYRRNMFGSPCRMWAFVAVFAFRQACQTNTIDIYIPKSAITKMCRSMQSYKSLGTELTSFVLLSDCFFSVTPIMPENKIPKGPWGEIYLKHWQCWKILDLCGTRRCFSSSTCPLTCFQGSCGCFLWLWQYARVPTTQLWIYRTSMIDKKCKISEIVLNHSLLFVFC